VNPFASIRYAKQSSIRYVSGLRNQSFFYVNPFRNPATIRICDFHRLRDAEAAARKRWAVSMVPDHHPMIPHVIVLEPGLVIFKICNGYWFFGRPTIEELRQDLRAVLRKCRPDGDITRPELRAAWVRGERDRFYPHGKTYGQVFREQE
jgi:hypothetical protein